MGSPAESPTSEGDSRGGADKGAKRYNRQPYLRVGGKCRKKEEFRTHGRVTGPEVLSRSVNPGRCSRGTIHSVCHREVSPTQQPSHDDISQQTRTSACQLVCRDAEASVVTDEGHPDHAPEGQYHRQSFGSITSGKVPKLPPHFGGCRCKQDQCLRLTRLLGSRAFHYRAIC